MYAGKNMWRTRNLYIPTLAFMALMIVFCSADDSVHIRSKYGQMVTSSTLRWIKGARGSRPKDAFLGSVKLDVKKHYQLPTDENEGDNEEEDPDAPKEVEKEDMYVCRARHNGAFLPGRLGASSTACHVSLLGRVFAYDQYEVLQNEEGGGRLTWVHWDRYSIIPVGSVGGGDSSLYYVARRAEKVPGDDKRSHYVVGKLDTSEGMGRISVSEKPTEKEETSRRAGRQAQEVTDEIERHYTDGQVLVETEPKSYELSVTEFKERRKKVSGHHIVLATGQLINEATTPEPGSEDESSLVDTVLTYKSEYSVYWGQGKAMLKGLMTAVIAKGKVSKEDIGRGTGIETLKWGLQETETKQEARRVEARLLPGTAANVSLVANKTSEEMPFEGILVAHYGDNTMLSRNVSGSRRLQMLRDIRVIIGPAFFLNDGSLVPTTTTTTTTTTTEATTTTTPGTTTNEPPPTLPPPEPAQSKKMHSMLSDEQSVEKETWNGEARTEMKLAAVDESHSGAMKQEAHIAMAIACASFIALGIMHRT